MPAVPLMGAEASSPGAGDRRTSGVQQPPSCSLPRLGVGFGERSLDALMIAAGARGLCELVWVVDGRDAAVVATRRLLERLGVVVDVGRLSSAAAARRLADAAPQALVTFRDSGLGVLARIAAHLQVGFHAPSVAARLEDKLHQRRALARAGVDSLATLALPRGADEERVRTLASRFAFPAVLKPRRASGSWHTFPVGDLDALVALWDELADEPPEPRVLEQRLADGPPMPAGFEADYVSVESLVVGGRPAHLALTGRLPCAEPFRETGFFIPATIDGQARAAVLELATRALDALGVRSGVMHTEIKLTGDGPRVLEVNGRVGGGVPEMLGLACGVDIIELEMRAALGLIEEPPAPPAPTGVAFRFFYQPPAGTHRLLALDGLQDVLALPGVRGGFLHHPPGSVVDSRHGSRTYLFAVHGLAADHAEVARTWRLMHELVRAQYG